MEPKHRLLSQRDLLLTRKRNAQAALTKFEQENQNKPTFSTDVQRNLQWARARINALPVAEKPLLFQKRRLHAQNERLTQAFLNLNAEFDPNFFDTPTDHAYKDAMTRFRDSFVASIVPEHAPFTPQQRVENTLKEMKAVIDPNGTERGRGRLRGAILPIATGLAASYAIKQLINEHANDHRHITNALKAIFNIGGGAWTTGIATAGISLGASASLRLLGRHNHLDMYARYSHVGGLSKETKNKIPKVEIRKPWTYLNGVAKVTAGTSLWIGRFAERGVERGLLKHVIFRIGENRKTRTLAKYTDGKITVGSWSLRKKQIYLKEGFKYLRDGEALNNKNAHFTKKEEQRWNENKGKVKTALVNLIASIPDYDQQTKVVQNVDKKLNSQLRNAVTYWAGSIALATTGAIKAMLIDSLHNAKDGLLGVMKQTGNTKDKLQYFFNHPYGMRK